MKSNKNDNAIQAKKTKKILEERNSSLTGEVSIGNLPMKQETTTLPRFATLVLEVHFRLLHCFYLT